MGWVTKVQFPAETGIFLFFSMFRPVLGSTQSPIQCVLWAVSPGIKQRTYVFAVLVHNVTRHFNCKTGIFVMGHSSVCVIKRVRVLYYICRKDTVPPKSDDADKKDDDKDDGAPVRESEEDTNDRYTE